MRARRYAAGLLLAPLLTALAACSSVDDQQSAMRSTSDRSGSSGGLSGDGSRAAKAAWNPCSDLRAARVGADLGAPVKVTTGTAAQPRCAFLPVRKGGPTLNVTYLWFDGSFDDAFSSMGRIDGTITSPRIPGADSARLVVNANPKATLVTGFVKTGRLLETVNAVRLAPADPQALARATVRVMTTLAAHAPRSEAATAKTG